MTNPNLLKISSQFIQAFQRLGGLPYDMLSPDASYLTFNGPVSGRDAIAGQMKDVMFDDDSVASLQRAGNSVHLIAKSSVGSGSLLTLHFEGEKIRTVQSQPLPPREESVAPLALSEKIIAVINDALAEKRPMIVAHIGESGQPVLSYRGSISALKLDQLGIWIRHREGGFIRAIRERPAVALMYRDNEAREQLCFQGRARIARDEAENLRVYDGAPQIEQGYDPARSGIGVVVDIDSLHGFFRGPEGEMLPVRMARDAA